MAKPKNPVERILYPRLADDPTVARFYRSLGIAISAWQVVEESLYGLYEAATVPERFQAAVCGYHVLQFRAKLAVTDASLRYVMSATKSDDSIVAAWAKLHKKTQERARARNDFAHFQVVLS